MVAAAFALAALAGALAGPGAAAAAEPDAPRSGAAASEAAAPAATESALSHTQAAFAGWREVRTEHFRIIYEPAHEAAAREVISFAEDVYADVTESLGYHPETVPVVIRGRTAAANGFYSPFPHHISLFVTSPSGVWMGARHESWLRVLLTHELTHFVQFTDRTGLFGDLSRVFGHDISVFSFPFMPGWYVEAPTTLNETRLTSGGRGRNPFFEMQVKAPVLEGKLWSLDQASYESAFAPRGRIYIAGYVLADYLRRTYGEGTYARVHREFERFPFFGVGRAIRRVTGDDSEEVYADMHADLIRRFAPDARMGTGRRVSPEAPGNWYLPIPTEAGLFGYVDAVDRRAGIYRSSAESLSRADAEWDGELALPVRLTDPFSFDVSADGSRIAVAVTRQAPSHRAGSVSYSELWLYDVEGDGVGPGRRVTTGGRLWHPALSADGSRLVAVERRGSYSRLVEVDTDTGAVQVLHEPERASVYTPRIAPDGTRIAFVEHSRGFQDVMLLEEGEGSAEDEVRPLRARTREGEYLPRFADAETLLYSSDREGRLSLYSYHLPSETETPVVQDRIAAWAGVPVGGDLLYGSYTSEGYTLRLAAAGSDAAGEAGSAEAEGAVGGDANAAGEAGAGAGDAGAAAGDAGAASPAATSSTGTADVAARPAAPIPPPADLPPLPEPRTYRDVPRPLVWAPYLELYADTDDTVRLPAGVYLYGAGILGRTSWDSVLAVDAAALQPRVSLGARYAPGPLTLAYGFDYRYRPASDETYRARIVNEVSASALPWYARRPAAASGLSTTLGAALETEREADEAFDAAATFETATATRELDLSVGARVAHAAFSPPAAYFGGFGADAGAEARFTPPVLDADDPRLDTFFGAGVRVPTGLRHHVAGLRVDGVSSTSGSVAGVLVPTSGADWESGDADIKLDGRLDYRIPLGVYDQPLPGIRPYKPALLGLGATLYAGSALYIDATSGQTEPEDSLFFGLEAEGRFTITHLPLSAGAGVVVRVDRNFSEPVGSDDTRVYVFVSSDLATRTDAVPGTVGGGPAGGRGTRATAGAAGGGGTAAGDPAARHPALPDRLIAPGHAVW